MFIFNRRIIALQYFVGFWQASAWISHGYTYVPSLSSPSHLHLHCIPSRFVQSPSLGLLNYTANSHWLSVLHMVVYAFYKFSPNNPKNCKLSSWVMGIPVTEVRSGEVSALPSPNESWGTPLSCWATLYYKVARAIQMSDCTWARWFLRSILSSIILSIKLEDEKVLILWKHGDCSVPYFLVCMCVLYGIKRCYSFLIQGVCLEWKAV